MKTLSPRIVAVAVAVLLASVLLNVIGFSMTHIRAQLLPADGSDFTWRALVSSDQVRGGGSEVRLDDERNTLRYQYTLDTEDATPYASMGIFLGDRDDGPNYVDFSQFTEMVLYLRCAQRNVLTVSLHSIDSKISVPHEFDSYRVSRGYVSCHDKVEAQSLDLGRLHTPGWWLIRRGLDFSNQSYDYLNQVHSVSIGTSPQTQTGVQSSVHVERIELTGNQWLWLYVSGAITLLLWVLFSVWVLRHHTQMLAEKLRAEIRREAETVAPLQPVEFESRQDKERADVLQYMAREYTNPELSMDVVVESLGMNREKINNILREESELTFSGYLNKLRLAEAARLLSTKSVSVAEVAYAVGYKNVSYFNRLFKKAYDATPNAYKAAANQ